LKVLDDKICAMLHQQYVTVVQN